MKEKPPAFLFYPKDWLTDDKTMAMTFEDKGKYVDLLALQYLHGGVISGAIFNAMNPSDLLRSCFTVENGGFYNPKLRRVIQEYQGYLKKQAERGSMGGKAKRENERERANSGGSSGANSGASGDPNSNAFDLHLTSNPEDLTKPPQTYPPARARAGVCLDSGEDTGNGIRPAMIVDAYVKRIRPGSVNRALQEIQAIIDNEEYTALQLMAAVDNYASWPDLPPQKYRKQAANFFGNDRTFEEFLHPVDALPATPAGPPCLYTPMQIAENLREWTDLENLTDERGVGYTTNQFGADWREKMQRGLIP